MVHPRAARAIDQATKKKAVVHTAPLWAEQDPLHWHPSSSNSAISLADLLEDQEYGHDHSHYDTAPLNPSYPAGFETIELDSRRSAPSVASSTTPSTPAWGMFATMSNVSTLSTQLSQSAHSSPATTPVVEIPQQGFLHSQQPTAASTTSRRLPLKLDEMFRLQTPAPATTGTASLCTCPCNCSSQRRSTRARLSAAKRRHRKGSLEVVRGYPSGLCLSTEPPTSNPWDEKDVDFTESRRQTIWTNTAISLENLNGFIHMSNIVKYLSIASSIALFAIAVDAIVILFQSPDQHTRLDNNTASLIFTIILSVLTIGYSCFTLFLEKRRSPAGLNSSKSQPLALAVVFSEILVTVVWAQVLGVGIYIYVWTCTEAGESQRAHLWKQDLADDQHRYLTGRICQRQGSIVGLEVVLILLLIFNFYTHLSKNFQFIRAVSEG